MFKTLETMVEDIHQIVNIFEQPPCLPPRAAFRCRYLRVLLVFSWQQPVSRRNERVVDIKEILVSPWGVFLDFPRAAMTVMFWHCAPRGPRDEDRSLAPRARSIPPNFMKSPLHPQNLWINPKTISNSSLIFSRRSRCLLTPQQNWKKMEGEKSDALFLARETALVNPSISMVRSPCNSVSPDTIRIIKSQLETRAL